MTLLMAGPSPFVRTVLVTAHETGQIAEIETRKVAASPTGADPELVSANPLGKIPALMRPDGPALYDSRVICRYLDHRAQAGLYPDSRLWEVLTLEATAQAMMDAGVSMVYERRVRPEDMVYEPWIAGQWGKITRALDAVEARWTSHLSGRLTMAQIALGCALGYLDFRHGDRGWREGRPTLAAWYARFAERPSMQETEPAA
ncbi:glutathione S-transferase [Roseivivax isoporae]|uniref:Glutathione S-transferase n=1 Tax=Roseivivax isoporae LMG 25204 TaxID=1449351 RepID=X7FDM2_9RHOB|nr:glutathione S-transferase [Roseivivax isoporae]ETX30910.1 glutathione S-transferase [Roseivivax isoporae LMG 25204]